MKKPGRLKTLLTERRVAERRASAAYAAAAADAVRQADVARRLHDTATRTDHPGGLLAAGALAATCELAARIQSAHRLAEQRAADAGMRHSDAAFDRRAARKALVLVIDKTVVEERLLAAKREAAMPPLRVRCVR